MVGTELSRRLFVAVVAVPILLVYFGFGLFNLGSTILILCAIVGAVVTCPPLPDPDMDPVSAACINKEGILPGGAPTHLTLVMYFEKCPDPEVVSRELTRVMSEYPRFNSVAVPNRSAAIESSWKKVNFEWRNMVHSFTVSSDKELDDQIQGLTLGTLRPLAPNLPAWRADVIKNTGGNSVVVWILDHMFGDGIGILPLGLRMGKTKDGKPYQLTNFDPKREGVKQASLIQKAKIMVKDFIELLAIPTGPFDTKCSLNRNAEKKALDYDGKRFVEYVPDFPLQIIRDIKNHVPNATVNDVFVALWAGTMRRYLERTNDPALNDKSLMSRGQAPFSFPRYPTPGKIKNDMVFVVFKFPIAFKTIRERLAEAHEEFERLKRSTKVFLVKYIASIGLRLGLDRLIWDSNLQQWHRTSWMFSNVPGPQEALVIFDQEMVSFRPYYANLVSQAIFFSYNGKVSLSMVLDGGSIEHPKWIGECFEEELEAMRKEVGC